MKRMMGAAMAAILILGGCGGDDAGTAEAGATTTGAPESSETAPSTTAPGPPIDREGWRETADGVGEVSVDGETTELTGVTCRALGPTDSMRWIVTGSNEALVFVEADLDEELPLDEETEVTENRVLRVTIDGTDYEVAEETSSTDPTGTIDMTVNDHGATADVRIEGETDDGTAVGLDLDCQGMTARDEDGNELAEDGSDADECPFLTADDVTEALGRELEPVSASDDECTFSAVDDEDFVFEVRLADIYDEPDIVAEESLQNCNEGTVIEVEVGDRAFACENVGPGASYYEGDHELYFTLAGYEDEDIDSTIAGFAELLEVVTVPPDPGG